MSKEYSSLGLYIYEMNISTKTWLLQQDLKSEHEDPKICLNPDRVMPQQKDAASWRDTPDHKLGEMAVGQPCLEPVGTSTPKSGHEKWAAKLFMAARLSVIKELQGPSCPGVSTPNKANGAIAIPHPSHKLKRADPLSVDKTLSVGDANKETVSSISRNQDRGQ